MVSVLCFGFFWSNPNLDFSWDTYEQQYALPVLPENIAIPITIQQRDKRYSLYPRIGVKETHIDYGFKDMGIEDISISDIDLRQELHSKSPEAVSTPPPDIEEEGALEFWMVEVQPTIIQTAVPEHPVIARQAGIEGVVTVMLVIGTDGRVENVRALAGPAIFHEEAIRTAYRMGFTPAYKNNMPVRVKTTQRIIFRLN